MTGGKIVRTIGGESVKTAKKSITLTATEGDLTFNSPTQVIMNGKQGGVQYLNNYVPPPPLRVLKLDGPFDAKGKKVSFIKKEILYKYKIINFTRSPKANEIKRIRWATQFDDGEIKSVYPNLNGKEEVEFWVPKAFTSSRLRVFAYMNEPAEFASVETGIFYKEVIRLEITAEVTGYTIQALKGLDFIFSDPAVIVPTYKTNILNIHLDKKGNKLEQEEKGEFDVTRDAWYNLGKNKSNKYEILNRAFVPANYNQNLYGVYWIPSYPNQLKIIRSGLGAFILTRFGERKIPAKPLKTQMKLDGTSIDSPRKDPNFATDVMIHIGGTYSVKGYEHLGGSYGCFGFIQKEDIFSTPELAKKASEDDDYDDNTSNEDWKKITNKIVTLSFPEKKELQIILLDRDESKNYYPTEILSE